MKVAIRIGHKGIGTGASGAGGDEVMGATAYGEALQEELIRAGYQVLFIPSNPRPYGADYREIVNPDPAIGLYLQCHLNSAPGIMPSNDHGMIFYDHRSTRGPVLAKLWCDGLAGVAHGRWRAVSDDPAAGYPRVHPCIREARPPALLLEPWFIQVPRDARALGHELGRALVAALRGWPV